MNESTVRVVVVDDQPLIRDSLRSLLETVAGIEVVGSAGDGREALTVVDRTRPDVVLMDVQMPVLDGIAATERLRSTAPRTQVVVLTTYDLDEYVFRAVQAGAAGFLLKDGDVEELVRGIRAAARGEALVAPTSLRRLLAEFARRPGPEAGVVRLLDQLTEREREVLRLMAAGLNNAEIAERMVVELSTVKSHVSRVLAKLAARDRTQAVVLAYQGGLL
jgi:DNA-binding NarL/FixJ family response regulator